MLLECYISQGYGHKYWRQENLELCFYSVGQWSVSFWVPKSEVGGVLDCALLVDLNPLIFSR